MGLPCDSLGGVSTLQIQEHVPLGPMTTMGVGGAARFFAEIRSEDQLVGALGFAREQRVPAIAIGGGSNLLVRDEGYPGLILRLSLEGATVREQGGSAVELTVPAGVSWDAFVLEICAMGLSGVECLAGIPGLTGGTPVQNVGAYGQEVAQTITAVRAFDREQQHFVRLSREECGFSYRSSIFNTRFRDRFLITAVTFALEPNAAPRIRYEDLQWHFGEDVRPSPMAIYHAVRAIRQRKGMLLVPGEPDCRSAGSFFKNPIVDRSKLAAIADAASISAERVPHWPMPGELGAGTISKERATEPRVKLAAAWLVEQAGFGKGFRLGEAGISSRHSLALINRSGRASFAEIARLRDLIREGVAARFGVRLEQEPIELGAGTEAPLRTEGRESAVASSV